MATTTTTPNLGFSVVTGARGVGGQALTNNFNILDQAGLLAARDNNKYTIVACILYYDSGAGVWKAAEDQGHMPINFTSVTATDTVLDVKFSVTASCVVSFLAVPDEAFALAGYSFGASVGTEHAYITCVKTTSVASGYFYWYNGNFTIASASGGLTVNSWDNGCLELGHDYIPGYGVSAMIREDDSFPIVVAVGSMANESTILQFYDLTTGGKMMTEDAKMQGTFTKTAPPYTVNPQYLNVDNANIWCYAVLQL